MKRYVVTDILGRTFNCRFNDLSVGGNLGNVNSWSRPGLLIKEHFANFVVAEDGTLINVAHVITISPYGIPVPKEERVVSRVAPNVEPATMPSPV